LLGPKRALRIAGMIRGVIFDLDNTLTDFMRMKELSVDAAIEAMIDAGLTVSREDAKQRIYAIYAREGIEFQQVFDHFLQDARGEMDYKIHAAAIVAYRRAREASLILYPHVKHTLIELMKRGQRLAVLSDAPRLQAWLRLCTLGLHHMFDHVIAFEDTGTLKPSGQPFRELLARMDMTAGEMLMVGDWPERDMVGASKVGIRTVFARYGDTKNTTHSGADYEIDDIIELLPILEALNAG
jgi:putative hydrolase of the HAD superfamily